jgi:hypothetical protein
MSGPKGETPAITRELIAEQHPAIAESFRKEGQDKGFAAGAEAERARIKSVREQSMPGHEALISTLMFDGKTTGPEAAVQVLKAENAARDAALAQRRSEAPKPLPTARAADPAPAKPANDNRPLEERCKEAWDSDSALREEFSDDYATYLAYEKANANGQVRRLAKTG